ncbi:MAG: guanylate kinase [Paramuribaculum sp.]|nr:guanylate kinase [Paramuribaculum sp.]
MATGKIIIISAPSGCGKSTIIRSLNNRGNINWRFSVSATNRHPRTGEQDGVDYHFLTSEDFSNAIADDAFIEYEEVYPGRYYGTLKSEVQSHIDQGENVVLDIDVKGALRVKKMYGNQAISIFIMPPSIETLRQRLENRATDSAEAIAQRVSKADYELSFAPQFDKQIVNDDLETAVENAEHTIKAFLQQ